MSLFGGFAGPLLATGVAGCQWVRHAPLAPAVIMGSNRATLTKEGS